MEDLEALVGHVYVVGRRAISAPPPGALVELAPKRVPRGREQDAFFVLVLPASGAKATAEFYEGMARLAAERYFAAGGGVAACLRDVLNSLNANLLEHNQGHPRRPFYADIVCMVLRQQEIYIAKTGGGLVLLWQGDAFESFPYELNDRELTDGQPLGYGPEPVLTMAHYTVRPGHLVALGDASLAGFGRKALADVGREGGVQRTVERLKALRPADSSALVIELVSPDAPDPTRAPHVAPHTAPPVVPDSQPEVAAAPAVAPGGPQGEVAPAPAGRRRMASGGERLRRVFRRAADHPRPSLTELQSGGEHVARRLGVGALRLGQRALLRLLGAVSVLHRMVDRSLPEPEAGRPPSLPTPVAAGIAVLIPVAIAILVVGLSLTTRDETAFERCLAEAQEGVGLARLATENNNPNVQESWSGAMVVIDECMGLRHDDPVLLALREEAQGHLDGFDHVTRCPTTPLRRFARGADLHGVVLRGVDLYTLDAERSAISLDTLNEVGNALTGESQVIVQRGMAVGEFTVRNIVDINWLIGGGIARGTALIALDTQGVLFSYSPTSPPVTGQALLGAERWIRPIAIDTWQGRLYVLDTVADQIWRYQPTGDTYPGAPEEYFVGENRPDLESAVDFAIDETGNIYVLNRDGTIRKFFAGNEERFQFAQLPSGLGLLGSANAMHLDTGLISPGFYILDEANRIIYETTLAGTFINSYRAPYGISFQGLGGLVVDESAQHVYFVARDTLYHFQKCG